MDESVRTIPQVALWIPLDSVDKVDRVWWCSISPFFTQLFIPFSSMAQTNGTVWVHPFPPMDSEEARDIRLPPNDFSAWHTHLGQESQKRPCPAIPILASPGDLLILSPHAFHFSQGNASFQERRVWMPQYSSRPIPHPSPDDLHPLALAIPCRYGNKVNTTL